MNVAIVAETVAVSHRTSAFGVKSLAEKHGWNTRSISFSLAQAFTPGAVNGQYVFLD
jgi:hypothetical protein